MKLLTDKARLGPVLGRTRERIGRFGGPVLFVSFMLSIAAVVLSNSAAAPERILLWLVLPVFLVTAMVPPRCQEGNVIAWPPYWLARSFLFWTCVVYVCAAILSTLVSWKSDPHHSRVIWVYARWGAELLLFIVVVIWLSVIYPRFFRHFLIVMVAVLAVNAVINIDAIIPALTSRPLAATRLAATFGTPDFRNATHVAPLFAIYAMAAIALIATTHLPAWQQGVLGICALILLIAIALTQARGALVSVFLAASVLGAAAAGVRRYAILFVLAIAVAAAFVFEPTREALLSRGTSFRTDLWKAYFRIVAERPLLGHGLDRLIEIKIRDVIFEQPHNTVLWAQLRLGVVGTVAVIAMLAGSLLTGVGYWRRTGNAAPFIAFLMMAVTALTEIGFLVFPYSWIWITFWLPVAIGAGIEASLAHSRRPIGPVAQ